MIIADMTMHRYFTLRAADAYGQRGIPKPTDDPDGMIKMAVYVSNQAISDNAIYSTAEYVGLTMENVDDSMFIEHNGKMLKVLHVTMQGRFRQAYMARV